MKRFEVVPEDVQVEHEGEKILCQKDCPPWNRLIRALMEEQMEESKFPWGNLKSLLLCFWWMWLSGGICHDEFLVGFNDLKAISNQNDSTPGD